MTSANPGSGATEPRQSDSPARDKGFWALNWLRFVLALYLVLFHTLRFNYAAVEDNWLAAVLGLGNMITSVFFILSGFLLTHAYVVMKHGRDISTRNFLIARLSTLYPLHLVALLIAIVPMTGRLLHAGGVEVRIDTASAATRIVEQWEVLLGLFMSVTLLNAWNPFYLMFNGPSWSLSALAFYYILFPFVALRMYRMQSPATALVLLGILFLLPGITADLLHRTDIFTEGLLHRNPIIRLPLFIAGIALCVIFARNPRFGTPRQTCLLGFLIVATVIVAAVLRYEGIRLHIVDNGLYFPASLAVVWMCACARPTLNATLRHWGTRLGGASLPMFLLHIPLFSVYRKIEQVILVWPSTGSIKAALAAASHVKLTLVCYPIYLVLLITICVLVQERFVTRIQKFIRNRYSDRKEPKGTDTGAQSAPATGTYQ